MQKYIKMGGVNFPKHLRATIAPCPRQLTQAEALSRPREGSIHAFFLNIVAFRYKGSTSGQKILLTKDISQVKS